MSSYYADYHSGLPVYTEWQQLPTQTPDYMEWQEPYLSHAQLHHAAPQPGFQQPQPPCVGSEWCGIPQTNQFGYHPCQPPPNQPPDPLDWTQPEYSEFAHLPPPPPRYTSDLEPNLSMAALVSQLERLTADVEQLVSRMDAKERRLGDPHAATRPPPATPFSVPYTAPESFHLPQSTATAPAVLYHVPHQVSTPNSLQPDRFQQPASYQPEAYPPPPPYQPDGPYAPPAYSYTQPPDYSYPSNYTPFTSNITNLPQYFSPQLHDTLQNHQLYDQRTFDGRSESMDYPKQYWDFDENWDASDSRRLSRPYLRHDPSRSSQPAAPVVPPPPPQRSPFCWSSTSPMSHCRSAAPLPAAAAAPSLNLPPPAPPCSPDIIGYEDELLDDDRPPPTMMTLSCSPDIRYDSMELIVDDDSDESVKSCSSNAIDGVKAIMIYCPRRPRMHVILGIHEVDEGAIDALAVHLHIWSDIGFIECRKVGETSLGNIASLSTSQVSAKQRSCTFDPGGSTSQHFARDGKKIESFIESKTEDPNVGSDFLVTSGIMSANAKMYQRRTWKPYTSANFSYLSLLEPTSLKGWDLDVMLSVLIPWILVTHDDLVVSLSFIGGLSRNISTNLRQIPSVTFWVASVVVGILLGKSWFTYATSIEKGIDESFVIHGGSFVVMVQFVITKVDEELLQSFVAIAFGTFCVVVRSTSHAHVAANFLYEWDLSQQISKLQAPISGFLLHIHRNYASVNFCNTFHEVAAAGGNLEYNGLKGETGYKVHDPGLAIATLEIVEQQWRTLAHSLVVGKNDSENQMVAASMFFTPDGKVRAPLVDFLGRISK